MEIDIAKLLFPEKLCKSVYKERSRLNNIERVASLDSLLTNNLILQENILVLEDHTSNVVYKVTYS